MGLTVRLVHDPAAPDDDDPATDEIAKVERLRYDVYHLEKSLFAGDADHDRRRLRDPQDPGAVIWLALDGDEEVGTIRLLWARHAEFSHHDEETFGVSEFIAIAGPDRVGLISRFIVRPEARGGVVAGLLLDAIAQYCIERRIDVALCDAEPHLVSFYEALGFRPYRAAIDNPEFGLMVPLVMLVSDRPHLQHVGSFVVDMLPDGFPSEVEPELAEMAGRPTDASGSDPLVAISELFARSFDERPLIFEGLDDAQMKRLAARSTVVDFTTGDMLIKEGHASRTVWVLLEGSAEIVRAGRVVAVATRNSLVGELALLHDTRRSADVRATSPGRAIVLSPRTIEDLTEHEPEIATKLLFNLCAHLGRELLKAGTA